VNRQPNLAITIVLYIAGILLVILAILVLLKAFGAIQSIPTAAIWGLVMLGIGAGILAGIRTRTRY
jgi:hypothetical protein